MNPKTNKTDWATFTWNPVKGCRGPDGEGPCAYCYARDIAEGVYPDGFEPRFYPERLGQPMRMRDP
jgi:protein gp37